MRNVLIALGFLMFGCGVADHDSERVAACAHIEGSATDQCNGGDDFAPLSCPSALAKFEGWWRDSLISEFNLCMLNSACYPGAQGIPGPSIDMPMGVCMDYMLYSGLMPSPAEQATADNVCMKLNSCSLINIYTLAQCEEIVLNPYVDGSLFLLMNDSVAQQVDACNTSDCVNYKSCVSNVFSSVGAYSSIKGIQVKMPAILR